MQVVGWFTEHCDPLLKVSIVPRGSSALGFAQYLPNENLLYTLPQLQGRISMTLGGRAAEDVLLGQVRTAPLSKRHLDLQGVAASLIAWCICVSCQRVNVADVQCAYAADYFLNPARYSWHERRVQLCLNVHFRLQVSTGAQNDLEKITQMAYSSVAVYGMNAKIGLVSFPPDRNRLDKPYSDETAQLIDAEARQIITACYERTKALLEEKRNMVETLALVRHLVSGTLSSMTHLACSQTGVGAAASAPVCIAACSAALQCPACAHHFLHGSGQ